jgi:isopentenyl-diphosphate Delta-isomerase
MEDRKKDHINLAFDSQTPASDIDSRFYYEPMLSAHPDNNIPKMDFAGKTMRLPIWVSSMTGGTKLAATINHNLARACHEFGMGMGLGSCRILLHDDLYLSDFNMRDVIGNDLPFYANLGINQLEVLIRDRKTDLIHGLLEKLRADGLIIHVNPFQEWFQPEGDRLKKPALESIEALLEEMNYPLVVKEVGQGMGYHSLKALLKLPLAAIEFGAFGGTNFSRVELLRGDPVNKELHEPLARVGHDALHMLNMINRIKDEDAGSVRCKQLIVSGGIKSFLDGYYLINKSSLPAVYGQASAFLKHAQGAYEPLRSFVEHQIKGLQLAYAFLRVREEA